MAILKLSVLLQPGGPTMISGTFASMLTTVQNKFSSRAFVGAIPFGTSVLLKSCISVSFKMSL